MFKIIDTCQFQDLMESHFTHTKHNYQDRATSTHEWFSVDDDSNIHQNHGNIQDFTNPPRPSTSKFSGRYTLN